jgi:hypothetical protein
MQFDNVVWLFAPMGSTMWFFDEHSDENVP